MSRLGEAAGCLVATRTKRLPKSVKGAWRRREIPAYKSPSRRDSRGATGILRLSDAPDGATGSLSRTHAQESAGASELSRPAESKTNEGIPTSTCSVPSQTTESRTQLRVPDEGGNG